MEPISLYIHIPFCRHRCAYCDFNTYAGLEELIPSYVEALCREIAYIRRYYDQPPEVHTVFLGGGTPSLLPEVEIAQIMTALRANFTLAPEVEITLEANPGTVSRQYLQSLREMGVNRLSLGMQSASPEELRRAGRTA